MKIRYIKKLVVIMIGIVIGIAFMSAFASSFSIYDNERSAGSEIDLIDRRDEVAFNALMDEVSKSRVIYIGETHDRFDHHLNQLAVIKDLFLRGEKFAIGLEFFQSQFQSLLDDYVANKIGEKTLLKKTSYYQNWGYDFRLYRPILEFARNNGIKLLALNAPAELVSQVSRNGFHKVDARWKGELPVIQLHPDTAYRHRLKQVFDMHPGSEKMPGYDDALNRFTQVQLLWDEYMASTAASYLTNNQNKKLVVLAGSGHVAYDSGIPQRVHKIASSDYTVLVSASPNSSVAMNADYAMLAEGARLPKPGRLGLEIASFKDGVIVKRSLRKKSRHDSKKLHPGDVITSIAGEPVRSMEDVRLAMLDRAPGEQVWVEVERGSTERKQLKVSAIIDLI